MISARYKFIYLHVPKTGGNSLQKCLQPYSDDKFVTHGHQEGHDRFEIKGAVTPRKHATLADYALELGNRLENYKTVVSVRHPLDRAISYYFSPHRWMKRTTDGNGWTLENPFWNVDAFEKCFERLIPMVEFITLEGRLIQPDHVIRFETLTDDADRCATALGLGRMDLPHVNKSHATEIVQEAAMNSAARDLVAEYFAADYQFFGYSVT